MDSLIGRTLTCEEMGVRISLHSFKKGVLMGDIYMLEGIFRITYYNGFIIRHKVLDTQLEKYTDRYVYASNETEAKNKFIDFGFEIDFNRNFLRENREYKPILIRSFCRPVYDLSMYELIKKLTADDYMSYIKNNCEVQKSF
jgi:hypothetical protein